MIEIRLYRVSFNYGLPAYVVASGEGEANLIATQRRGHTALQSRCAGSATSRSHRLSPISTRCRVANDR